MSCRTERDLLGERELPLEARWGIHGLRAQENFPLSGRPCHPELVRAFGLVKQACAEVNAGLGAWRGEPDKESAILQACRELAAGEGLEHVVGDALQGGAGTSLNLVVNEVLANRALEQLGLSHGDYSRVSPLDDINLHQSTNDTFPTALRLAALGGLLALEQAVLELQEAFQDRERAFAHLVKVGRTQLQDAVLTTLGREMSAYAEALSRDRWRLSKARERLRVVNLGGTAIGSGLGAPRAFIYGATDRLRELAGLPLARAENLVEATQNADIFVDVGGLLKTLVVTLRKSANDLRLLSSGPQAGLGELHLPARQTGSSIMPGKVNPVIPEAVLQVCFVVDGNDVAISAAAGAGTLELNPFLPLIADRLLESLDLLTAACRIYRSHCVLGIEADETRLRSQVEGSTATATALVPRLGYEVVCGLVMRATAAGRSLREQAVSESLLTDEEFSALISAEAVLRLGS